MEKNIRIVLITLLTGITIISCNVSTGGINTPSDIPEANCPIFPIESNQLIGFLPEKDLTTSIAKVKCAIAFRFSSQPKWNATCLFNPSR